LLAAWFAGDRLSPFMAALAADAVAVQGEADLKLARAMVAKLVRKQKDDMRKVSDTTINEAVAAAALAIVQWRNGVLKPEAVTGEKTYGAVSVVAWRACSKAMSENGMADTLELSSVSDAFLFDKVVDAEGFTIEPLAVAMLGGYETRDDKAKRLLLERAKGRRKVVLPARMERFKVPSGPDSTR
jgi:hypothetical protein